MKNTDIEALKANDPYQPELVSRLAGKFRHMKHVPVATLDPSEFSGIACLSMEAKVDQAGSIGYAQDLAQGGDCKYMVKINREKVDQYGPKVLDSLLRHEYFHSTSLPVTPRGLLVEFAIIKALGMEAAGAGKSWLKDVDPGRFSNILEDMFADWTVKEKGNDAYVRFLEDMVEKAGGPEEVGYPMDLLFYVRLHQNAGPEAEVTKALKDAITSSLPDFPLRDFTDILDSTRRWNSNADFLRAYCRLCRLIMKHWPDPTQSLQQQQQQQRGNGKGQGQGQGDPQQGSGSGDGQGNDSSGGDDQDQGNSSSSDGSGKPGKEDPNGKKKPDKGKGGGKKTDLNDPADDASGSVMDISEEDIAAAIKEMKEGLAASVLKSEGVVPDAGDLTDAILSSMGHKGVSTGGKGVGIGTGMKLLLETLNDPDLLAILFPPVEGQNSFGRSLPLNVPPKETFKWGSDRLCDIDVKSTVKRFGGGHTTTLTNMRKRSVLDLPIPVTYTRTNTPSIFTVIDTSGSMNPVEIARSIMIMKKTAEDLHTGFGLVLFHSVPYFSDYWPNAKDFKALEVVQKIQSGGTQIATALLKVVDKCATVLGSTIGVEKQTGYLVLMSDFELAAMDRAAYANLCLTNPTLSMLRQVHISISKSPVQLPAPHIGLQVKSFKEGAKQASELLKQSRYEPSVGMNRY